MAVLAKLQDLVDSLDMQNDQSAAYLDRDTGEVHVIAHAALRIAEDGTGADDLLRDSSDEEVELAQRILDSDRFAALPTSWDVHEWNIMEAFCSSIDDEDVRADCLGAIHGRGAFRYFKDLLARHGLKDAWYAFRAQALAKVAIEWCEDHDIAFSGSTEVCRAAQDAHSLDAGSQTGSRSAPAPGTRTSAVKSGKRLSG